MAINDRRGKGGGHTGSEKEWRTRTDESRGVKVFVKETAVHLSQ